MSCLSLSKASAICLLLKFTALLSFSSLSFANDKTLVIGGVKFPPLSYIDEKGGIRGPAIDYLNQLLDRLNQPYRWIGMNQNRLYRLIANGSIDLTAATKKYNELDKALIFSTKPWACLRVNIFSAPGQGTIRSINDLEGAQLVHYYYFEKEDLMKELKTIPGLKRYSANNRKSAIKMLLAGRVQYYLDFHTPVAQTMAEMNVDLPYKNILKEAAFMAAPVANPGSEELIERIDALLADNDISPTMPISDPQLLSTCVN